MQVATQRLLLGLLITILCGVVFHAPLSIFLGSLLPEWQLEIKAWKEVLLLFAACLVAIEVTRQKKWRELSGDWIVRLSVVYAAIHILLLPFMWQGSTQAIAALMIDLRYVLFFVVVYAACRLYPAWRRPLIWGSAIAAAVSLVFALLQVTILPRDILSHIGYDKTTIAPYLTVDENDDYVRINGTLRGPNPLGIYATIVVAGAVAFILSRYRMRAAWRQWVPWGLGALAVMALVAAWFSYSRSALIAFAVAVAVVLVAVLGKYINRTVWAALGVSVLLLLGGVYSMRDTPFISHVVLHEDPDEGGSVNSNDGHWASLVDGTDRMIRQPLGAGVGSTGSPSLMGNQPLIIENQYLYIAHETGWLGLAIFVGLFGVTLHRLWLRRADWLALGLLASGTGAAIACLFLPVWADDTVSLVWWGLAGVAIAPSLLLQKKGRHG